MTETEFNALAAAGYNRVPIVLETFADLDTPLSIYLKLANEPYTYLLESVVGGERFGRYSFIGLAASKRLEVRGYECAEIEEGGKTTRTTVEDPLAFVQSYLATFRAAEDARLPRFCGGLVGYFGYETVRYIEKRLAGTDKPDPLGVPDILLLVSEEIAIVDNLSGKLSLVVYAEPGEPALTSARGAARGTAEEAARARCDSSRHRAESGAGGFRLRRGCLSRSRGARQEIHLRRRHHAGRAFAAHVEAVSRDAARALSRAAHGQPLAVHVLLRPR